MTENKQYYNTRGIHVKIQSIEIVLKKNTVNHVVKVSKKKSKFKKRFSSM